MGIGEVILMALAILAAVVVGVFLIVFLIVPVFKGIAWVIGQLWRFVIGEIGDAFRLLGALILAVLYVPVILGNLVIGRWSACGHYGRALTHELSTSGLCLYRMAIGHPLRLFKAEGLVEGVEQRLPAVVANAPTADLPAGGRSGQFDGYQIVGSLAPGGSGAKLYIAVPDAGKKSLYSRQGFGEVSQVVVKVFSTKDGSSLPQIVRESRSLDAAKRLGLILDHELSPERFYYVMRYVPGEPLSMMTKSLHAGSPPGGLGDAQLRSTLGYVSDLVATLTTYHRGGLWHKDVKPDNVIIDGLGRAHLVDFGLVSSLRSAMTLTTHGTEYFRDPEMVRMALRGAKVHEVDGTRFDIYGAGAVLYATIEDGFPAHGVLSQVTKRCPESVKWIIRRAMTDYDKRYVSAEAMLADLATVAHAADPFAVRPADLPSMRESFGPIAGNDEASPPSLANARAAAAAVAASAVPPPPPMVQPVAQSTPPPLRRTAPAIRIDNWWSGRSAVVAGSVATPGNAEHIAQAAQNIADHSARFARHAGRVVGVVGAAGIPGAADPAASPAGAPASGRERSRFRSRDRIPGQSHGNGWNGGVLLAVMLLVGVLAGGGIKLFGHDPEAESTEIVSEDAGGADVHVAATSAGPGQAPLPIATSSGTVLVVSDLLQPWSETAAEYLQGLTANLRDAGFELEGNVHPTGAPVSDAERDLIAGARLALGQSPLDEPGSEERLRGFLDAHADQVQVVVWVAPARQSPTHEPAAVWVARAESSDELAPERTRAVRSAISRTRVTPPTPPKAPPTPDE